MKPLAVLALVFAFYVVLHDLKTIVAGPFIDYDVCERVARLMSESDPGVFPICVGDPR